MLQELRKKKTVTKKKTGRVKKKVDGTKWKNKKPGTGERL